MSAKGDQVTAAVAVVAWRVIDADGRPATDWIDGDGRGRYPVVAGGSVQLAYSHPEDVRVTEDINGGALELLVAGGLVTRAKVELAIAIAKHASTLSRSECAKASPDQVQH